VVSSWHVKRANIKVRLVSNVEDAFTKKSKPILYSQMTNALAYKQAATQDSTQHNTTRVARRPGITTGFSTGKKLPHDSANCHCTQPHQAYNPVGIH